MNMDHYIVSARKYRPANFSSVVGQQSLTATLKNAILSNKLAHAYLFCGGRGVGKTSCARIFAKAINCTNRNDLGEACEQCDSCRQFNEGRSLNIIELDAASHNGIEDIKGLIEQAMVPPTTGRYRVFIIDEVHMLSTAAFNAFLKTLEEPPAHAIFILATTEKHKILPTILSRCQIYDFNRIGIADMVSHMQMVAASEGIEAEPEALAVIARKADGAMRDALSIFDQVAAFTRGHITYAATIENLNELDRGVYNRLLDAMLAGDVPTALLIYKEVRDHGFDSRFFITGLGQYLRDIMVSASPETAKLVEAPESERRELAQRAAKIHPTFIYKAMELCNDADFNFRAAANKQFLIELTLIRQCQLLSPSPGSDGDGGGHTPALKDISPSTARPNAAATPKATTQTTSGTQQPAAPQSAADSYPATALAVADKGETTSQAATALHTSASSHQPAPSRQGTSAKPNDSPVTSIRLGDINDALSTKGTQPSQTPQKRSPHHNKACTDDDILSAWKDSLSKLQGDPMLMSVAQMADADVADNKLRLTVPASVQADMLTSEKDHLIGMLRKALDNDDIDMEICLDDSRLDPAYWTEKRVLENMLRSYPMMAEYMKKFNLHII